MNTLKNLATYDCLQAESITWKPCNEDLFLDSVDAPERLWDILGKTTLIRNGWSEYNNPTMAVWALTKLYESGVFAKGVAQMILRDILNKTIRLSKHHFLKSSVLEEGRIEELKWIILWHTSILQWTGAVGPMLIDEILHDMDNILEIHKFVLIELGITNE